MTGGQIEEHMKKLYLGNNSIWLEALYVWWNIEELVTNIQCTVNVAYDSNFWHQETNIA